jgi:myosin heavy subunit
VRQEKGAGARRIVQTLAGHFRRQLGNLMETVDRTEPHYIRWVGQI